MDYEDRRNFRTDLDTLKTYPQKYLEISDCHRKVRLHMTSDDSEDDFLTKMELLKSEIQLFINHLKDKQK